MENKRKVKIIDSIYKKDLHVFKWLVQEKNSRKEFWVVVPLSDIINISVDNISKIPEEVINKFCEDLKNKDVFLASEYDEEKTDKLKGLEEEKMLEKHNEIDKFPCYEAYKIAEEVDNDNNK